MLTLLIGTDWVANSNRIMELIARDVRQELNGRILIVPELISHDTERRLVRLPETPAAVLRKFSHLRAWQDVSVRTWATVCRLAWMRAAASWQWLAPQDSCTAG